MLVQNCRANRNRRRENALNTRIEYQDHPGHKLTSRQVRSCRILLTRNLCKDRFDQQALALGKSSLFSLGYSAVRCPMSVRLSTTELLQEEGKHSRIWHRQSVR